MKAHSNLVDSMERKEENWEKWKNIPGTNNSKTIAVVTAA